MNSAPLSYFRYISGLIKTFQERIRPWLNAKAEAESLGIEIELKNKMLAELRADLNRSKKKIEDLQSQNDQLVKATHKSEEKDAKVLLSPD